MTTLKQTIADDLLKAVHKVRAEMESTSKRAQLRRFLKVYKPLTFQFIKRLEKITGAYSYATKNLPTVGHFVIHNEYGKGKVIAEDKASKHVDDTITIKFSGNKTDAPFKKRFIVSVVLPNIRRIKRTEKVTA